MLYIVSDKKYVESTSMFIVVFLVDFVSVRLYCHWLMKYPVRPKLTRTLGFIFLCQRNVQGLAYKLIFTISLAIYNAKHVLINCQLHIWENFDLLMVFFKCEHNIEFESASKWHSTFKEV